MTSLDRAAQLEYILEHYQNPHHHGSMPDADASLQGGNPGCGDLVTIFIKVEDEHIKEVSFEGEGCTISQAATSILTDHVVGKSMQEIERMDYQLMVDELGEEAVKMRPRCATLGLDTLKATLQEYRKKRARGEK